MRLFDNLRVGIVILLLPLLDHYAASAQDHGTGNLFQAVHRGRSYYIDINDSVASVFEMSYYLDNAGTGHSIRRTDTLHRQPDGIYLGKHVEILPENGQYYLIKAYKKRRKAPMNQVTDLRAAFTRLNNAFYLDHYFQMADLLNRTYPLSYHSFRNGFYTWKKLENKEEHYLQFRDFANARIQEIKDSISQLQERYIAVTDYIVKNLKLFNYNVLKDSLAKLPPVYRSESRYFGMVVSQIAKQEPEYFFRLAEDYPAHRSKLFYAVEDDEEIIQSLRNVQGHDEIKREFFKDRRFSKTIGYRILGTYLIIGGLVTWLIVSQP